MPLKKSHRHENQHFRELPSHVFIEHRLPKEFRRFVRKKVLPELKLAGYKLVEKKKTVAQAIHQLVETWLVGGCVSDSRDWQKPGAKLRCQIWDAIVEAGFARVCLGSELAGKSTRYRATPKLMTLRKVWELDLLVDSRLARNSELDEPTRDALVFIHSGKADPATNELLPADKRKQLLPIKGCHPAKISIIQMTEDVIEAFNRNNLEHSWQAFETNPETGRQHVRPIDPTLRQIHVGCWLRMARFYTRGKLGGQSVRKEVQKTILIDGQPVVKLDVSGSLIRMLYHDCGINPDPAQDIYRPEKVFRKLYKQSKLSNKKKAILRDFVKRATNICWNVKSQGRAHSTVGKLRKDHVASDFLYEAIFNAEQINIKRVVQRIQKAHPDLAKQFFTDIGTRMITVESRVMEHIMLRFVFFQKPALAMHDAVIVKKRDEKFARNAMIFAYKLVMDTTFAPVIKREF